MKKHSSPVILTCSLCSNFDPNRSICKLNGEPRIAISDEYGSHCKQEGKFIRDMNVLLEAYNFYTADEEIPFNFEVTKDSLPVDEQGIPLFVSTKRGIERAVPANETVNMKSHPAFGVERIFTYQGQRELIYELGVEKAQKLADESGIKLTILPEENDSQGDETYIHQHQLRTNIKEDTLKCYWLSDEPSEGWD